MQKLKSIPIIEKLNQHSFMPVIWWSLLVAILPYVFSLLRVPITWRVGLLFLVVNSMISFQVGTIIYELKLNKWWLILLPVLFDLMMLPKFASYNLVFGLIYLIFELFGLINKNIYR